MQARRRYQEFGGHTGGDTGRSSAWFEHYMSTGCVQRAKDEISTCFVASALAASAEVKGFSHCQLSQMGVCLINVAGSPFRDELVKGVTIVGDAPLDLHHSRLSILDNGCCSADEAIKKHAYADSQTSCPHSSKDVFCGIHM